MLGVGRWVLKNFQHPTSSIQQNIKNMKFNTKVIHGGQHHEPATGAVNVPVFLTSTFAQKVRDS